jgi:hypothetical protein
LDVLSTPVVGHRPLRRLTAATVVLVWLAGGTGPLAVFAASFTFGASASTDAAQAGAVLLGGGLLATYLVCVAAGGLVVLWLWRARANAAAAGTWPQRWAKGWVVAGWLVPVANLWIPAAVVADVVRASASAADPHGERLRAVVPFWWAAWLGAWLALSTALAGTPLIGAPNVGAAYLWFTLFSGLSVLLFLAAAAAFTRIVLQVAARQDQRVLTPSASVPGPDMAESAFTAPATVAVVVSAEPATPPSPTRPKGALGARTWLLLAVAGVALFTIAAIAVLLTTARDDPADVVATAMKDVRGWSGMNHRGTVPGPDGAPVEFDISVTASGALGTLTRDGGSARAEVLRSSAGVYLNGNRMWWQRSYPNQADVLADRWIADPGPEAQLIEPILRLHPGQLSYEVRLESPWVTTGEQVVNGERALVLSDGLLVLIVTADEPHRILFVELMATGPPGAEPIEVSPLTKAQADEVALADIRVYTPRTLTELLEALQVDVQVRPEPLCATPACTATFTVTNTSSNRVAGRFEMTADGRIAGFQRLDLPPGQSATFSATTPNKLMNSPGASGDIHWVGRFIPD